METYKAICLLGEGSETHGTCFLVNYCGRLFAVTNQHIIIHASQSNNTLFALPGLKKTKNPKGGYDPLPIRHVLFNPNDTDSTSYDVAVCMIEPRALPNGWQWTIPCIKLVDAPCPVISEGLPATILGYSVEYVEENVKAGSEEYLRPLEIKGTIIKGFDLSNVAQDPKQPLQYAEFSFIECRSIPKQNFEGICGSLVLIGQQPAGVVFANYDPYNNTDNTAYFLFAKLDRILETLRAF